MSFENESFDGQVGEPTATKQDRSAFATLKSLDSNPLEQARKFVQYADSCDARKAKLAKSLTEAAQELVAAHYPRHSA
jgi:hypothetical protein